MDQSGSQSQEEQPKNLGLSLGIDFGNSQISAAVWLPDKKIAEIIKFDSKSSFPSTLYFSDLALKKENQENNESNIDLENLNPEIGVEYTPDKNLDYFVYDIKKFLGSNISQEDIKEMNYKISFDEKGELLCFEEKIPYKIIPSFLIKKVVETAEEKYNNKIEYCTISVPHGFNTGQRNSIIEAAKSAGIKNVFIINDPLTTCIYYISTHKLLHLENFLIIDFGSSKLDISLVSISKNNSIKIIVTGGGSMLLGNIFENEIFKEALDTYKNEGGNIAFNNEENKNKFFILKKKSEKAKIKLTFENEASFNEKKFDGKKDLQYIIKRERFDELNRENYTHIIKLINKLIKDSGIKKSDINHIFLQGNAIRIVKLKEKIIEDFPDIDINELYNSIPIGAAIYTAKKINQLEKVQFNNFKIYDITPLSLGIRAEGDLMSVILPRGSKVPIKAVKYFITTQDNQTNIKFEVYAGERKLIKDNILLTKIMLKNLPMKNKGQIRIQVIFEVDENFNLNIEAKEISTNEAPKRENVYINENLSQNDIIKMVEDAKKNEKNDLEEKTRIQAMLKLNDKIFEYSHLFEGNEDILRELESYRNWIKHSTAVPKEEYENKLQELNEAMQKTISHEQPIKIKNNNNKIEEEKNNQ
jgi:molecular chaperone DnaK (HSP70)